MGGPAQHNGRKRQPVDGHDTATSCLQRMRLQDGDEEGLGEEQPCVLQSGRRSRQMAHQQHKLREENTA